jgi:probable F420-dependent oxidoreductase
VSEGALKVGISLGILNPTLWVQATEEADRLGYESVWMPEHLVLPVTATGSPFDGQDHPPVPPDIPVFDVFTYLGYLAARTTSIRFGTYVFNIGLRHPFTVARGVATLDVLSAGRVEFGIGASWNAAEWAAVGLDFSTRGRRVDEAIDVCRHLWTDSVVEHHGEFFDFDAVMFEPKPVQTGGPPLHIGGDAPAALRRAAVLGDGWIPMNHTLDQIPAAVARLAELRADAGRAGTVEVSIGGDAAKPDDLERYAEAGVDRIIVRPWRSSKEAIDGIRRFAGDILHR